MRSYLSQSPELLSIFSDDVLDVLDGVVRRAVETLRTIDPAERNEIAARSLRCTQSAAAPRNKSWK